MREPEIDPPLIGTNQELDEFFYWASNEIFIERNLSALLQKLRAQSKELAKDLAKELEKK